ncbi:unnamed protein product, partial [Prorocentrum cordatum]
PLVLGPAGPPVSLARATRGRQEGAEPDAMVADFRFIPDSECHVVGDGHLVDGMNVRCDETALGDSGELGSPPTPMANARSSCQWPDAFQADPLGECRRLCDASDKCKCFTFAS